MNVEETFSSNYLSIIPDELKIEIFSYLNTIDIIQLSQISTFQHLSYDKNLIRNIRLYKEYQCRLEVWNTFVLNKFRSDLITSLNVNCIYWIPALELRKALQKLRMLKSFYAVGTKLGLNARDSAFYNSLEHLKTLAVTVADHDLQTNVNLSPMLLNLYLHVELMKHESITRLSFLLNKLKLLEDLWIIDLSPTSVEITVMRVLCSLPSSIRKLTVVIHRFADFALVHTLNIKGTLTFKNLRSNMVQISFEQFDSKVNDIYNAWDFEDESWKSLVNRLKYDHAFGQKDARKLILGQVTPDKHNYEELNIAHSKDVCSNFFKSTATSILTSPNMRLLKKLAVNFCLCEQSSDGVIKREQPLFKRARVGISNSLPEKSTLEKIIDSSPLIEELEIWACTASNLPHLTNAALSSIENLKNLKNLTLHNIPEHIDGQFLLTICKSCSNLSSLRIKSSNNINLHNNLCKALLYANSLKDFRYERFCIPIDKLIDSLNESPNLKLERIMLKCSMIEKFSTLPFQKFLYHNPQLKFLCMAVSQVPKYVVREISISLNKFKDGPEQIFIATTDDSFYRGQIPIPHVHKSEMMNLNSCVCALDIFNGFAKCS